MARASQGSEPLPLPSSLGATLLRGEAFQAQKILSSQDSGAGALYLNNFRDILPGKNHYSKRVYFEPQLCHFKYLFLKAKSLLGELHYLPWT